MPGWSRPADPARARHLGHPIGVAPGADRTGLSVESGQGSTRWVPAAASGSPQSRRPTSSARAESRPRLAAGRCTPAPGEGAQRPAQLAREPGLVVDKSGHPSVRFTVPIPRAANISATRSI